MGQAGRSDLSMEEEKNVEARVLRDFDKSEDGKGVNVPFSIHPQAHPSDGVSRLQESD